MFRSNSEFFIFLIKILFFLELYIYYVSLFSVHHILILIIFLIAQSCTKNVLTRLPHWPVTRKL
jgi:hypothetical protein